MTGTVYIYKMNISVDSSFPILLRNTTTLVQSHSLLRNSVYLRYVACRNRLLLIDFEFFRAREPPRKWGRAELLNSDSKNVAIMDNEAEESRWYVVKGLCLRAAIYKDTI